MAISNKRIAAVLRELPGINPLSRYRPDSEAQAPCKSDLGSFKRVEPAIHTANLPARTYVHQSHPKQSISQPLRVPAEQRRRMIDRYNNDGESIRKIARQEGRARQTVTRIVRSADTSEYDREIERMRQEFRSFVALALESLSRAMEKDKTGMVAARYLENIGVIPKRRRR